MNNMVKDYYSYKAIIKEAKETLNAIVKSGISLGNIDHVNCLLRQIKHCNEACRKLKTKFNRDWLVKRERRERERHTIVLSNKAAYTLYLDLLNAFKNTEDQK